MKTVRGWAMGATLLVPALLALAVSGPAIGQGKKKAKLQEWTVPDSPTLPIDYKVQGEYVGGGVGCQVIALGGGRFQAVVLPGGLPGAGWDGKHKSLLDGKHDVDQVVFEPAKGKRKYKAQKPEEFSATSTFPPPGQKDFSATLVGERLTLKTNDGKTLELKKTVRQSPTMGAKPPADATVLFDGKDASEWVGGRADSKTGWLNTDRKDIRTRRKFNNYTVHAEFLIPFLPDARDQGRGNSGFYQVDLYEVQILDSFGLDGKNNECGGVYQRRDSLVNACLPPLTWQTYDIDFTNAVRDGDKVVKKARITAKLNGITIHDDAEIGTTPGGRDQKEEGTPGPLKFQGHGNVLQFRNVWVVEKK
ncbi:MAG: DUF1080 domain-containing protein [Gemmataceae bacterium]